MAFAKPNTNLNPLLNQWKILLQQWAKGGSLVTAAKEALLLSGIPEGLQILIDEWSAADFNSLPENELLSAADISSSMGPYAISTGKIYLNENWLEGASNADVFVFLTEELGHHLDELLNVVDTPGDEGQLFAALLTSNVEISDSEKESLQAETDHSIAILFGSEVAAEQSKGSYSVDTTLVNLKIISGKTGGVTSGLASFYSNDEEIILVLGNKYDYSAPSWITSNYILTKSLKSGLENIFDYINPSSKLYTTLTKPTIANGNKLIFRENSVSAATFKQTLSFNQIELNELRSGSQKVIASYEYEDFADSDIHSFFGNKLGDQIVRKNNQLISFGPHSWSSNIPSYENLIGLAVGQANDGSAIIVGSTGLKKFSTSEVIRAPFQVDGKSLITKINADGTKAWNKEFDFATLGEDYFVASIDNFTNDFLLAGSLQDNLGVASLINFTADGIQKWRLDLHNLPHSRITSASIDSSGNIFIAGTWQFDWIWNRYNNMANGIPPSAADVGTNLAFYGLVSKEGTLQWTNTYGDNTGSIFGCEILSTNSGNIILTGTSTSKQIFGTTPNVGSSSNGNPYMYGYIAEISVPQSQVTITLTPSAAAINEGAVLTSTIDTTNLATGTKLYYALSGTGITTADFSAGALTGEGSTDAAGKFSFSHTLANDLTTEGAETLSIKLFSDEARKVQVGATAAVSIVDTSNSIPVIDLSKGEVDLILNIKILTDSGFSYSDLSFSLINPPSNLGYYAYPSVHINRSDKVTGSTKDGTYSSIVKVGSNALSGTYAISSLSIKDSIGNQLQKSGPDLDKYLASIGINKEALTFSVIGTAPANTDSAEPKLSSAMLSSKAIDLSKGETDLLLNTTITDASGLNYSYLSFSLANPPSYVSVINPFANISTWSDKISGSNKDGSYSSIVKVGSKALPGTYAISSLSIADTVGNSINKYGPDLDKYLESIGINKEALTFSVIGTAPANTDSTEPKLSLATLSSKAIDLSKGETDLLLNTTITDASGFSFLSLRYSLVKADGSIDLTNPKYITVSLWDKISGTINNGSYSTIITLGADFDTGTYVVDNLSIADRGGISISKSSKKDVDAYLGSLGIDPASLSFAVTGEPPKPVVLSPPIPSNPVLTKSSALNSIDQKTFNAGDLIAIEIDFSDIIGLDDGILGNLFIHPANSLNPFSNSWNHTLSTSDISNGSSKEGTIRKTFEIPSTATAGEWYVSYLKLSDKNGNQKTSFLRQSYPVTSFPSVNQFEVFSSQIGVPGSSLKFTVANDKVIDTKSPIIKAIRFDSHEIILGDNGAYFKIEIDFLDESGLNGFTVDESLHSSDEYGIGWLSIAPTSPSFQTYGLQLTKTDLIKGTAYEGTLSKNIYIPKSAQPGEWHITAISLGDANGNEDNFYLSGDSYYDKQIFASQIGISIDDLKFKIIKNNSADVDYEPPVIRAIRFGSDKITIGGSGSQQLFEFDYSDLSGIGSLYSSNASSNPRVGFVQIQSPSGEHGIYLDLYKDDISKGDIYNGTIRKQIDLPANSPPGIWSLYTIELNDRSGLVESEQMRFSGPNQNLPTSSQIEHLASRLGLSSSSIQFNVINSNVLGSDNTDNDEPSIKAIRFLNNTSLQTTYTLTPSAATINEGSTLTTSVAATNLSSGTTLYYSLSGNGITAADFSAGALTGLGTVGSNGKLSISHTLANDLTTEGAETVEIKLYSDSARTLQVGSTATLSILDTSIKSKSFNLDVDGDGKVTALGDGLMVIRKLFGFAFTGDALTNKAISPTATRTTAEIHQFIESGISTGTLDVDKDGKTTALGDGLMVIRHLFGAAFAGAALTNKAISPDSPYFGPPVDHLTIANAIDSMKVIPGLSA